MTQRVRNIGTGLAIALLVGAFASDGSADEERKRREGERRDRGARMARALDLNEDQRGQLKSLGEKRGKALRPLQKQRRDQLEELRLLVKNEAKDARLERELNALKRTRDKIYRIEEQHRKDMQAVLTPIQQAKFVLRLAYRGETLNKRRGQRGDRDKRSRRKRDDS